MKCRIFFGRISIVARAGRPADSTGSFSASLASLGLTGLLMTGCVEESVLSDVRLTDPKLIVALFELRKDKASSTDYLFQARLQDKNGDGIEILDGGVTLNGIRMKVEHTYFGDVPYYTLSSSKIKFRFDSLYTFKVMLSDGSEYASSIRTQKSDLTGASTRLANGVAYITWTGDHVGPLSLDYTLKRDTLSLNRSMPYTPKGPVDTIKVPLEGYTKINYTLSTSRTGTVNTAFRSGSISSVITLKK